MTAMTPMTFLTLTAPVSLPFIPAVLGNLRKEFKGQSLVEQAVEDSDLIGDALIQNKSRRHSGLTGIDSEESIPASLHARADSSASSSA